MQHKITLSNTDSFTMQCFLYANFKFLNLTWDLKVGVTRIRNYQFQGLINELKISHIYAHADEGVYSKLYISFEKTLSSTSALLMGGCNQLHVKQRLIYKRSTCISIKERCIDAGIIATAQAIEGHHYYRSMHLHQNVSIHWSNSDLRKWKIIYFFKVSEKHKLVLWAYTSSLRHSMK